MAELVFSKKQLNPLIKKFELDVESNTFKNIIGMFNGSTDYQIWAIKLVYGGVAPLEVIASIKSWADNNPTEIKNLSKGNIILYKTANDLALLNAEMNAIDKLSFIKNNINRFNTAQRELLRQNILNGITSISKAINNEKIDYWFAVFTKMGRLENHRKEKLISTASALYDFDNLSKHVISALASTYAWDKEDMLAYAKINANDCSVVYNEGPIVVMQIPSFKSSKLLCGNGRTGWCLTREERYFNQYVKETSGTKQYFLFDFSKPENDELAHIGFTVNNGEITNAHSFSNNNLMSEDRRNIIFIPEDVKYFIQNNKDINAILENLNIPKSTYTKLADCRYTWDKDYFYTNFIEHLDTNDYDILKEDNNQLVVIYYNSALLNTILYNKYKSVVAASDKVIVFVDFGKSNADKEKCVFVFTKHNETRTLDYVYYILDGHGNKCDIDGLFGRLVNYYNLPLDIIKRPCSFYNELNEAISGCDINKLKKLLSEKDVFLKKINELNYNERNELICSIDASILNYHTLSVLEVFYDNGISLLNICPTEILINNVIVRLLYDILACRLSIVPSETDFNNLYTSNNDYRVSRYLGVMLALNKILNMEKIVVTSEVVSILEDFMDNKYLFIYMLKLFHDKIPPKGLSRLISNANERFATTDFTLMFAKTSPC